MKLVKNALATATLAIGALAATPASADLTFGSIPAGATNEFISAYFPGQQIEGYYGAQLYLVGGSATITAEYFGGEAGFLNTFSYTSGGGTCNTVTTFTHPGGNTFPAPNALGPEDSGVGGNVNCTSFQALGLMEFQFSVNTGAATVTNGSNPDNTGLGPNYFVSFDTPAYLLDTNNSGTTPGGGQSVFLFLDDGGASDDDNHDDMVIRLSITCTQGVDCGFQIPEPGSLALVGLALLGAGAARRRKSA